MGVGWHEWALFGVFEAIGALFYCVYGYSNSRLPQRILRHQLKKLSNDTQLELSVWLSGDKGL